MTHWFSRALVALSVAVACAKATDEELLKGGGDDTGGSSGKGASGGTPAFGGGPSFGGGAGRGGASTGGIAGAGKGGVGTGGTSGAAGASDGGASDGGAGPDPCSIQGTPPALRVDYKSGTKPVTDEPDGQVRVVNDTTAPVPLSEVTLRYWFHSEFSCEDTVDRMAINVVSFQFDGPYAAKQIPHVVPRVVSLDTGAPGCDAYFQLAFDPLAGSLAPEQWASVGFWTQIPIYDGTQHNQTNDYSYGACTMAFVYWDKITVYRNGRLIAGSEPGGGGGEGGQGGAPNGGMGGI